MFSVNDKVTEKTGQILSDEIINATLLEIRSLVLDFNYDAADKVNELIARCQQDDYLKLLKKLLFQIKEYEFTDADETIDIILNDIKIKN